MSKRVAAWKELDTKIDFYKSNSFRSRGPLRQIDSFLTKRISLCIECDSRYEVLWEPERFHEKLIFR